MSNQKREVNRLLDLQQDIEDNRRDIAVLEGRVETSMERLTELLGVDSIKEAEKAIKKLKKQVETLEDSIDDLLAEIEEMLDEDN